MEATKVTRRTKKAVPMVARIGPDEQEMIATVSRAVYTYLRATNHPLADIVDGVTLKLVTALMSPQGDHHEG